MHKNQFNNYQKGVVLSFISIVIFTYIILFEFILPANRLLPKPSILIDTIPVLFIEYDFLPAFLFSFSAVYAIMLISYFLIRISYKFIFHTVAWLPRLNELFIIGKYILPLFLIFLFNQWFNSFWGEYLFILIIIMGSLKSKLINEINYIPEEYIDSARSMRLSKDELYSKVIFKSIQPKLFSTFMRNHISIWGWVIAYEYICMTGGVGSIFLEAINYNDLSLIIILITIIIITILIMEFILNQIKKRNFFWT